MALIRIPNKKVAVGYCDQLVQELEKLAGFALLIGGDVSHVITAIKNTADEINQTGSSDEELALIRFGSNDIFGAFYRSIMAAGTHGEPLFHSVLDAKSYLVEQEKRFWEEQARQAKQLKEQYQVAKAAQEDARIAAGQLELSKKLGISEEMLRRLQGGGMEEDAEATQR